MGQIADSDYMGPKKPWPQTLKIGSNYPGYLEIMLVLILLNTTVNPSVDCYDADPIRGVPEQPRPLTSNPEIRVRSKSGLDILGF